MYSVILVIHVFLAAALVVVILLQRSEGGALGSLGGGSGLSMFTGRTAGNFLTRMTAVLATCFFCTSLGLALLHAPETMQKKSILDRAPAKAQQQPAPKAAPQPALPVVPEKSPVESQQRKPSKPIQPASKAKGGK